MLGWQPRAGEVAVGGVAVDPEARDNVSYADRARCQHRPASLDVGLGELSRSTALAPAGEHRLQPIPCALALRLRKYSAMAPFICRAKRL